MKLESTLPEKPGWIFITPGFDFVMLLMALVMFTGVVARESLVEVNLPPSEFRGLRMGEENMVIVMVKEGRLKPIYYVGKEQVEEGLLEVVIEGAAKDKETNRVAVHCDERIDLGVEQKIYDIVMRLNFRYFRVVRPAKEGGQ